MDTPPNEPTNQNSLKFQKLLSQRIKKRYLKLWGLVSKKAQYPRPVLVEPHNFFVGNFGMLTPVRKKNLLKKRLLFTVEKNYKLTINCLSDL